MRVSLPWTVARKADTNAAGRYSTALSAEMYPAYICAAFSKNSLRLLQLAITFKDTLREYNNGEFE